MAIKTGFSKKMLVILPLLFATLLSCKTGDTNATDLKYHVADTKERSAQGHVVEISEVTTYNAPTVFKDKLVVGIQANPTAGDNSGHYYVVLNDKRVDGEILRQPTFGAARYSDGYFIVFDLTPAQLATATREMNSLDSARTLTCVHAALKFVKQLTGYYMVKPEGQPYPNALPGETFALYLEQGFGNDQTGRAITHVYRTNRLPLSSFQHILTLREPDARARWANGTIDMKRFELSSSGSEPELEPLQLHD